PTCGMDEEEPPVVPAKAVRRAKTEAIHNLHVMHQSALYGTHRRPSRRVRRAIDAAAADASKSTTNNGRFDYNLLVYHALTSRIVLEPNRGRSRSMRRHCAADMEMERRQWKSADGRLSHAECNTSRRGGVGEMEERGGEEERVMLMSIKEDASDAEEDPFDRLLYFFDQTIDPYVIPPHWENYVLRGRALLPEEEVHDHLNRQGMENGGRAMEGDEEENEHFLRYIFSPASGGRRMAAGQDDDAELTERLDSTLSGLRTARSVSPPRPPPPPPTPRQEREQANGRSTDKVTVAVMDSVAGTTREVNYKAQNELSRGKGKDADAIVATPRDEAANKVIYEIYQDPYAERNLMEVTAARIPSVQKAIVALFILIEGRDDTPCAADDDGIIVDSIVLVTSPMKVSRTSDVKRDLGGVQSINEKWNNGPLVRIFIAFASAQDALDAGQE
ncbi:hypothetical protein PFISCL1PPCAC_7098, partial [Pristionchus fissidentatus]